VTLEVAAGSGGRGAVSFRREKYVPLGGPDGGGGGYGGDVVVVATPGQTTLGRYRDRRRHTAPNGGHGSGALRTGRGGADLVLPVPAGTLVRDDVTGELLADLDRPGASVVVAQGGRGGRGNARFSSPTRRAPRLAELGEKGSARRIHLELKLIADIGLVGLPNAGKSTLLAAITGAHPLIGDYPFTTLRPNLGIAELEGGRTVIIADVPGLIEGAHQGAGLGIDFLRHLERTRVLINVVDASVGPAEVVAAITGITAELRAFSPELAAKPSIIALNKCDLPASRATLKSADRFPGAHRIVAMTGQECRELVLAAASLVAVQAPAEPVPVSLAPKGSPAQGGHRVYRHRDRSSDTPLVTREVDAFRVAGRDIERFVEMTDLDNEEGVARLQKRMRSMGVTAALSTAGCAEGDSVRIGDEEFTFSPL